MIVFWRPPAMKILGVSFVAGTVGVGYILLHSVFGMDEIVANMLGFTLGCVAMVVWDIKFRKDNGRSLDDVAVSAFFGIIPTWVAGILLCIFMWIIALRGG